MTTLILTIDQMLVDHPEMRTYFHDDKEPADKDRELASAIALAMANTLDHVVGHFRPMSRRTEEAWRKYIADVHTQSPVLRTPLAQHKGWWPGLQEVVGKPPDQRTTLDRLLRR